MVLHIKYDFPDMRVYNGNKADAKNKLIEITLVLCGIFILR
jgi:hypothetical protein